MVPADDERPMKKPVLAALGITAACAACCAIPLALPLLAGIGAASLTLFEWTSLAVPAATGIAVFAGAAFWLARRRSKKACGCAPAEGATCSPGLR